MHDCASESVTSVREGMEDERRKGQKDKGLRESLESGNFTWLHPDCGWRWVSVRGLVSTFSNGNTTRDGKASPGRSSFWNRSISREGARRTWHFPLWTKFKFKVSYKWKYTTFWREEEGGVNFLYLVWFVSQSIPGGERSGSLRPWSRLSVLHLIVRFSYQYHATSYWYLRECYFFFIFSLLPLCLVNFRSFSLLITIPSFISRVSPFPSRELAFLPFLSLVSPSGTSPQPQPILHENVLARTFSAGRAHRDRVYIGEGGGGQDCLLSQKAKHLGWESLTVCLRTQTERAKASRKCFCQGDLHLSSIQLCSKESHLNTQYISSTPASDPIWEIRAWLSNLSPT